MQEEITCWVWWFTPVMSALRKQRQENCKFKASLGYIVRSVSRKEKEAGRPWLTPVIPAAWEAEIRRTLFEDQPGQIVLETPISKITRPEEWLKQ
jgi:hypothetical protein